MKKSLITVIGLVFITLNAACTPQKVNISSQRQPSLYKTGLSFKLNGDYASAQKNFTEAIEAKNYESESACFEIAGLHYQGLGVPQSEEKGMEWYYKCAESYSPIQAYNTGVAQLNDEKFDFADIWFHIAAKKGDKKSACMLAVWYGGNNFFFTEKETNWLKTKSPKYLKEGKKFAWDILGSSGCGAQVGIMGGKREMKVTNPSPK